MSEMKIRVDDLGFPNRLLSIFYENSITYVDELTTFTSLDILQWRKVSRGTLRDIRKILAGYGYSLKDDMLFDTESEKKIIQDMPNHINEISHSLRELERKIRWISKQLDELHCNMMPEKSS